LRCHQREQGGERVDRRTFLAQAGVIGAAVGTGMAGAAAAQAAPRSWAGPLVQWDLVGGFVGPGYTALRPAQLAIYPGGRAVADAERQLELHHTQVADLLRRSLTVLSNPANGRRRPGAPVIADVPSTLFRARDGRRHYEIQADGLAETREHHAYPAPLYSLLDQLSAVRERIRTDGRPYRGDGVRLVAVQADGSAGSIAWPQGVRVPPVDAVLDLYGPSAATVVRRMPRRDPWQWQVYRVPDGRFLRATWRYLLPHEPAVS
jgi:hypothetical protein